MKIDTFRKRDFGSRESVGARQLLLGVISSSQFLSIYVRTNAGDIFVGGSRGGRRDSDAALCPPLRLDTEFDGGRAPILSVVVPLGFPSDTRPLERLLVRVAVQHAVNDGHARLELDPHQAVRDGVRDVLEMLGRAFDQDSDGDDGGEGALERSGGGGSGRGRRGGRGVGEKGRRAHEVGRVRRCLDLGSGDHPVRGAQILQVSRR